MHRPETDESPSRDHESDDELDDERDDEREQDGDNDRGGGRPAVTFDALVLAGGRSRRMGEDKTVLPLDGDPLVVRVTAALRHAGAASVIVVASPDNRQRVEDALATGHAAGPTGRIREPNREHPAPVLLTDRWPDSGPVGGLLTGLAAVSAPWVLLCAADLPFLAEESVTALVTAAYTADRASSTAATAFVPIVAERPQWLFGLYPRSVLAAMQVPFDAGERSVAGCLRSVQATVSPVVFADGLAGTLYDVDTPEDVDEAARRLQRSRRSVRKS